MACNWKNCVLLASLWEGGWYMVKEKISTPFHSFPTIPILSLPCSPGDVTKIQWVWYIGLHCLINRSSHELQQLFNNVSCVYVQARCNSWVVSVAYTLSYFVIRGRLHRNHHLHSSGCTAVTVCWVGNIRCYTWRFPLPYHSIIWKSVQLLGCVWARPILKGHPAMYKRDFNCASSNSSPSDTEGAQAAQDTEEDDDDSKSVESDSEEDEPSIPSTLPSR